MGRKVSSWVFLAICVIVTIASVANVFGDNAHVVAQAEQAVCLGKQKCPFSKTAEVRTPLGQTFTFTGEGKTREVTCRRAVVLFGDYTCKSE